MSTTKPDINIRNIYEATEKEYDTVGYRQKLCDQWITFQQVEPGLLHSPTDLESNGMNATQRSRQKRHREAPADENLMAKKPKSNSQPLKIDEQKHGDEDLFDPYFDYEFSNKKMPDSSARKASRTKWLNSNQKGSATKANERSRSSAHSKDAHHSTKRSRPSGSKFDDEDFHDVQFNIDMQNPDALFNSPDRELISSMKKKSKNQDTHISPRFVDFAEIPLPVSKGDDRKRYHQRFAMLDDFPLEPIAHENNCSPQHLIYKHIREKSFAMVDTSPGWKHLKKPNENVFKENDIHTKLNHDISLAPNDDFFKVPDNRYALQSLETSKHTHRKSRKANVPDHHLVSKEMQAYKSSATIPKRAFHTLKTMPSQSTIFNIKCNNLVIKTD